MTESTPRPKRVRGPQPEALRPGLYAVDRFGERFDLTGYGYRDQIADADLHATEGYLRFALARVLEEKIRREHAHTRELSRILDLRDVEPEDDLPRVMTAAGEQLYPWRKETTSAPALKECAPIPCPPYVTLGEAPDADTLERIKEGLENLPVEDAKSVEDLPPHIREAVDEALANPEAFVKMRGRPGKVVQGSVTEAGPEPDLNAPPAAAPEDAGGVRPAMPWDTDAPEDPWSEVGGTGA